MEDKLKQIYSDQRFVEFDVTDELLKDVAYNGNIEAVNEFVRDFDPYKVKPIKAMAVYSRLAQIKGGIPIWKEKIDQFKEYLSVNGIDTSLKGLE